MIRSAVAPIAVGLDNGHHIICPCVGIVRVQSGGKWVLKWVLLI